MLTNENELKEKMTTAIEIFYKDECHKRLNVPIEENSRLEKKMQKFLYDWSTFNKREKVIALKNNTIKNLENEINNNLLKIKEGLEEFSGKSIDIQKKINGLLDTVAKKDKNTELEKIFSEIKCHISFEH